jgi:protein O-GlcNAc transferase
LSRHTPTWATFKEKGSFEEAAASFQQALALRPDLVKAHNELAAALQAQGKLADAVKCYRRAVELCPEDANAYYNLGNALFAQHRLADAAACFQRGLALTPDDAGAHVNLGNVLLAQNRLEEVVANYERALILQPELAVAHHNLALVLSIQGWLGKAITFAQRAMVLDPNNAAASGVWFELVQRLCEWADYAEDERRVRSTLAKQPAPGTALTFARLSSTLEEQLRFAREVAVKIAVPETVRLPPRKPKTNERIRLGYLSADFRVHPIGVQIIELIERHDRRNFKVHGYFWGQEESSAIRNRFARADNMRRVATSRGVAAERLVFTPWAPRPEYLARLTLAIYPRHRGRLCADVGDLACRAAAYFLLCFSFGRESISAARMTKHS